VLLRVDWVEIFVCGKKQATHERVYGNNKWCLTPGHYLKLIQQRPMSFNSARPIRQWRKMWFELLHHLFIRFCGSAARVRTRRVRIFYTSADYRITI